MALKTFVAYLVGDKTATFKTVIATSQADAMNKIFSTTSEDMILKSIYEK